MIGVALGLERMWATAVRRFRAHLDDIGLVNLPGADDTTDRSAAEDAHDHR